MWWEVGLYARPYINRISVFMFIQKLFFTILFLLPNCAVFSEGFTAGTLVKTPNTKTKRGI
jgi:hypothetical protein